MYFYTSAFLRGDSVYIRGYANGKRFADTFEIQPYLFTLNPTGEYQTLDGRRAAKRVFSSVKAAKDFFNQPQFEDDVEGSEIFGLSKFLYPYLNDEFSGEIKYDPAVVSRVSLDIEVDSRFGFPKPQEAAAEVTAITLSRRCRGEVKRVMFGVKVYKPKLPNVQFVLCDNERDLLEKFLHVWNDEEWIPDVVTGWNVEGFDITYLVNRIKKILGENKVKMLSPWRIVNERQITRGKSAARGGKNIESRTDTVWDLAGITVLDYMELYKKFSFQNHESYKLDHIAWVELKERKLDWASRFSSLHEFYEKDYEGFMDYNLDDTIKIDKLDDKLKLIEMVMALAYDAKVNYVDTMTTTLPWDVIIHNYLIEKKIVVPQYERASTSFTLLGGYVKEVKPGLYKWVVSLDLDSLYPHLIMMYNISPETKQNYKRSFVGQERVTMIGNESYSDGGWSTTPSDIRDVLRSYEEVLPGLRENNFTMTGNGCFYTREKQGFLAALMEKMYADRVIFKKKMIDAEKRYEENKDPEVEKEISRYHNMQLAKKIQLNSAYGALGNEFFRWFDIDNAEAITTSGRIATRFIEMKLNEYLNELLGTDNYDYVIAADTDSIYLCLDKFVTKLGLDDKEASEVVDFLDQAFKTKFEPFIAKCYAELAETVNAFAPKMRMKRESIANKGIWKARKMYILNVWDVEGVRYAEPKVKMKGIEAVRSSTPLFVRDAIKKSLDMIMNKDESVLQEFITEFKTEFFSKGFKDIARPSSANNLEKFTDRANIYTKGTPIHIRGALLYNHHIQKIGLENRYELIGEGTKLKYVYLRVPNPVRENVISCSDDLPSELGLDNYIDRQTQFEKTFLDPITTVTEIIGWRTEKGNSLLDLI